MLPENSWNLNGYPSHTFIQYGALVEIASLATPTDRRLYRSLELGIIRNLEIPFEVPSVVKDGETLSQAQTVIVTPLVCENIKTVANQHGFYVYTENRYTEMRKCYYEDPGGMGKFNELFLTDEEAERLRRQELGLGGDPLLDILSGTGGTTGTSGTGGTD